jgi:hypothetical protein
MRACLMTALVALAAAATARADEWRFRWRQGEVLTYRLQHDTTVTQVEGGARDSTASKLTVVKRWKVLAVDAQGVGTLELSLASMRTEQTRPDGEVLVFDSADPGKSTPELRQQLAGHVGLALAVLKVDALGKVVEVVKGAKHYGAEPPFRLTLPPQAPAAGGGWERPYKITLDPPHGTGEEYDAVAKFVARKAEGGTAVIGVSAAITNPPESPLDRVPLLQKQPAGEVVFDVAAGRLRGATLRIEQEVRDHRGPGSSYRIESTLTEQYLDGR